MSDIINEYLVTSLLRPHNADTRAIDKEITKWLKLVKYKTKIDEANAAQKQIESMIKTLI